LTARPQAARHDGLDAWRRPKTRFALDADGAGTGEELGANSTNVVDTLTNTSKQGITLCWKVSARPSALLPLKSNLSVVPTGRPKALGRPRSLQCNKTVLLLVLLVKLQSYDVWIAGKIIAQT
jgi:hypothetical protein